MVMLSGMRSVNVVPCARAWSQRQLAAQLVDGDALDDVHADAAAAGRRHLGLGREARARQELEQRRVGVSGTGTPARARDGRRVDAAAVVADGELELVVRALEAGDARPAPTSGLPARPALVGRLERVIDRVAHQVDDRREDPLGDRLVELGVPGVELQARLLAGGAARGRARSAECARAARRPGPCARA